MIGVKCFSFILFALPTLFPPGCVALIYRLSVYREDLQADFICGMIAIVTARLFVSLYLPHARPCLTDPYNKF